MPNLGLPKLAVDERFYLAILAAAMGWLSEVGFDGFQELPPVAFGIVAFTVIITYGWRKPSALLQSARFGAIITAALAAGVALATGQEWEVVNQLPLDNVTNVILLAAGIVISLMKRDAGQTTPNI